MVDVAPTILELAGATIPPEMDGGSFAPLLLGRPATRRDFTLIEYVLNELERRTFRFGRFGRCVHKHIAVILSSETIEVAMSTAY